MNYSVGRVSAPEGLALSAIPLSPLGGPENRGGHCRKHLSDISNGSQGWALRSTLQLADVALGVTEFVCQFLLAPTASHAQARQFGSDCLAQGAGFTVFSGTNLFGHAPMVAV
jgi:hypothetical protein